MNKLAKLVVGTGIILGSLGAIVTAYRIGGVIEANKPTREVNKSGVCIVDSLNPSAYFSMSKPKYDRSSDQISQNSIEFGVTITTTNSHRGVPIKQQISIYDDVHLIYRAEVDRARNSWGSFTNSSGKEFTNIENFSLGPSRFDMFSTQSELLNLGYKCVASNRELLEEH